MYLPYLLSLSWIRDAGKIILNHMYVLKRSSFSNYTSEPEQGLKEVYDIQCKSFILYTHLQIKYIPLLYVKSISAVILQ